MPIEFKSALLRFRCGNHRLEVEVGRWNKIDRLNRICKYCDKVNNNKFVEDELHFLLKCPLYRELRLDLMPHVCNNRLNDKVILKLLVNDNVNIGEFILRATRIRFRYLKSL